MTKFWSHIILVHNETDFEGISHSFSVHFKMSLLILFCSFIHVHVFFFCPLCCYFVRCHSYDDVCLEFLWLCLRFSTSSEYLWTLFKTSIYFVLVLSFLQMFIYNSITSCVLFYSDMLPCTRHELISTNYFIFSFIMNWFYLVRRFYIYTINPWFTT